MGHSFSPATAEVENLFDTPHHDARALAPLVASNALSGMFCAGEIGPVGPQSFLHGFTASAAIFSTTNAPQKQHSSGLGSP